MVEGEQDVGAAAERHVIEDLADRSRHVTGALARRHRQLDAVGITSPTLSLLVIAEKASNAAISAASSCLNWRTEPKRVEPLASTSSITVSSRSSVKRLT
ncbi:MAG: hypothetical protein U0802_21080 [Candidatus Binatia bacterium]